MPRILLPSADLKERHIRIQKEQARYLTSVLRSKVGDTLVIFDGMGNCLKTTIIKTDKREVIAEVIETFPCNTESPLNITLVQGLMKGEKMDLVIQKATELGVKEIIPTITERSQIRETRKVERWRKIAEEASRQSGRTMIPVVHEPVNFCDIFSSNPPAPPFLKGGDGGLHAHDGTVPDLPPSLRGVESGLSQPINGLIFWEEGGIKISEAVEKLKKSIVVSEQSAENKVDTIHYSLFTIHCPLFVAIGPEGGFTEEEVNLAKSKGLIVTSLGRRILRAETAAISAVTLVQFLLGDLG